MTNLSINCSLAIASMMHKMDKPNVEMKIASMTTVEARILISVSNKLKFGHEALFYRNRFLRARLIFV